MSGNSNAAVEMAENTEEKRLNPSEMETSPKSKKSTSAFEYFRELLTDSVVTGVPQIITVSNLIRKIFKVIILLGCIIGFIYQTVEFMNLYYTYPSTVEIELRYEKDLPNPAITICNRNEVQRSKFCKDHEDLCIAPKNIVKFCQLYPRFCYNSTTTFVDDLKFIKSDAYLDDTDYYLKYGQTADELIYDCCFSEITAKDQCRNKSRLQIKTNENKSDRKCYTIDFSKIHPKENQSKAEEILESIRGCLLWSPAGNDEIFTVVINLDPDEYIRPDIRPAAQVSVHFSGEKINPFEKGFNVEAGKRYTAKLSTVEEHLLPAPYSTECIKEYEDNLTREECLEFCDLMTIKDTCGCPGMETDNRIRRCEKNVTDLSRLVCLQGIDFQNCYEKCPRLCDTTYFQYEVFSSEIELLFPVIDLGDGIDMNLIQDEEKQELVMFSSREQKDIRKLAIIHMSYSKKEVTSYTYKPKYDKIEILGYIGGYCGIWLGISLVAIFDFFETLAVLFFFVYQKHRKQLIIRK